MQEVIGTYLILQRHAYFALRSLRAARNFSHAYGDIGGFTALMMFQN